MSYQLYTSYHELKKKNDNSRIWLEGEPLQRAGFEPGDFYEVVLNIDTLTVSLVHVPVTEDSKKLYNKGLLRKVSRRQMSGWIKPIIDVCNAEITKIFGEATRFRAQAFDGRIEFGIHPEDLAKIKRERQFNANMKRGKISKGDAFVGIGISADAGKQGFANEGITCEQKWAVEMEAQYLDAAVRNSPDTYKNANLFCAKVEEVEKHLLEPVDVFSFSMACTNHSTLGKAKRKLDHAEMGDEVTSLFGVVEMIKAANPAVLVSENVVTSKDSFSYQILKKELVRLGYKYHDMILDQEHSGALDRRRRYWMVAYSEGLNINTEQLIPDSTPMIHENVGSIIEEEVESDAWHSIEKYRVREAKNIAEGRNFKINMVSHEDTVINTIPRTYARHQVSNPHVPSKDGEHYRLFRKTEHAKLKRIPQRLVQNMSESLAHEGLGQSIAYFHAVRLVEAVARSLSPNKMQPRLL